MVNRSELHLTHLFPRLNRVDTSLIGNVPQKWRTELLNVIDLTIKARFPNRDFVEEMKHAVDRWFIHPDHGAQHSFDVYKGSLFLGHMEGSNVTLDEDGLFQGASITHDLGQFLPVNDCQGNSFGNLRIRHAENMEVMIRAVGEILNLPEAEVSTLAEIVSHHDDTYNGISHYFSSPLGGIFADSDKLYGAGFSKDARKLVSAALERNKKGAAGPQGWYTLRSELTAEERRDWRYGDKHYADRVSALWSDFFGTPFYTRVGESVAQKRRQVFWQVAEEFFSMEYRRMMEYRQRWTNVQTHNQNNLQVRLVGTGGKNNPNGQIIPVPRNSKVLDVIDRAYETPLELPTRESRLLRIPYGFMVDIRVGNNTLLIDPSIARFRSEREFLEAVGNVFSN